MCIYIYNFKNAHKAMDTGVLLGVKFRGERNFKLKKLVEMEEGEIPRMRHHFVPICCFFGVVAA